MRIGQINRGHIRKTSNQQKKHYSQMSQDEFDYILNSLANIRIVKLSNHLKRKKSVVFKKNDILENLNDSKLRDMIIEYNLTLGSNGLDKRVLIRSNAVYDVKIDNEIKNCNLCFVISLITHDIITAYYNESVDNHDTIDWLRYNKDLNIIEA